MTRRSFASLRVTVALMVILNAKDLHAQLSGQSFDVTPQTSTASVGDSLTLHFRVHLHERDMLLDTVPQVVGELPPGVRVLSIEKLRRGPDRAFVGEARIAFYRPGRRPVPTFGLPFMRVVEGVSRSTLPSDSAFVEIGRLLPAGNPALKDIKELNPDPQSRLFSLVVVAMIAASLIYLIRRRRRPGQTLPVEPEVVAPAPTQSPYEIALDRLSRIEQERWPARGEVAVHYESVVLVLRKYLEEAERVAAGERTSSELLWSLPPHLTAGGLRGRLHEILDEGDLVKFAEVRPAEPLAQDFLERARNLIEAWHKAEPVEESADALR